MAASEHNIDIKRLLRGYDEAERLPKDFNAQRTVPDFAFNILNQAGLLYRPVADEYHLARGGAKPAWPDGKPFAVCLTHDVDLVSLSCLRQAIRRFALVFTPQLSLAERGRPLVKGVADLWHVVKYAGKPDPLHCYERWLAVEEEIGARSTFFFWPGWKAVRKHHVSDCTYELTDRLVFDGQTCTVAEMAREIDRRGWEIGLHPSWYSFDDAGEIKRQKAALEAALGHEIVSVRQHFLHYDIRVTPRVQSEAGFRFDSTLGFNDNVGFRFGTSYPWPLYDLKKEAELPLLEIPLIIQDGAMLSPDKGLRLDEGVAFQYLAQITQAVAGVGGALTLIWHPHQIRDKAWWDLYLRALRYLKDENGWFCSVRELGEYWTGRNDQIRTSPDK